ncbi:MAG: TrmH family RNA methyltransferase [Archangium sp.]|nr:TrmH family RNA methyltransferase [Archangium sp.]
MLSPVVVCHQLRSPENLAAIARAMANFGFSDLILSDPQTHEFRVAGRIAVKADTVMEHFQVAQSLDEALTGVVYAVGTTSRAQLKRFTPLSPEQAVTRLATHSARGKVGLVLGGEKRGLSDDELSRCQDVLVIPTPGPQPSMNLSHAASILLYLCSRQDVPPPAEQPGASLGMIKRLEANMKDALLAAEFLNPQAPQHVLTELTRTLLRAQLTEREAQVWLAAFEHLKRTIPSSASR